MRPDAIIFDFDGVLIESEYAGNKQIADYLTASGHPTTIEQSMENFMGLAQKQFTDAVEAWIGGPLPPDFHAEREAEDARVLAEGIEAVAGAIAFIRALPADLPCAIASSSSLRWIETHLDHLGVCDAFGGHLYSGREHVARGKPAPDLYLYAAKALGVAIGRTAIIEDSPVGVTAAVASGAYVIGLTAGGHCRERHGERLAELGADAIADSFDEVSRLLQLV